MIASCLKRTTGQDCYLFEDINGIPIGGQKHRGEQRLVFYCCHGKNVKQVLAEIKGYTKKKESGNRIVFFNVPKDMAFEEEFDLDISEEDAEDLRTIQKVVDFIDQRPQ